MLKENGIRLTVACKNGCAWCCYQNVEVTIPEAILIAVETGMPDDSRGGAVDKVAPRIEEVDGFDRVKIAEACPFLGSDNSCTIYEVRPIACRTFFSPDAERCQKAFEAAIQNDSTKTVTSYGMTQFAGCALRAAIHDISKALGLQHEDVDLVSTVASIRNDPTLIDRWAEGKHVFKPRVDSQSRPLVTMSFKAASHSPVESD